MGVGNHPIKHNNTRGNCDTKMPQFSFFSRNKKPLPTRQDLKTIVEEKPVSTLFRSIHHKVDVPSTAFSLPVQHGHGFNHNLYQEPEEEVFSISVESPGRRLSQSYDWVDQSHPSSNLFTSSHSEFMVTSDVATSALELESSHASACHPQVTRQREFRTSPLSKKHRQGTNRLGGAESFRGTSISTNAKTLWSMQSTYSTGRSRLKLSICRVSGKNANPRSHHP